jgi:hypothetical protein
MRYFRENKHVHSDSRDLLNIRVIIIIIIRVIRVMVYAASWTFSSAFLKQGASYSVMVACWRAYFRRSAFRLPQCFNLSDV